MTPRILQFIDVSEKRIAFVFWVEEYTKEDPARSGQQISSYQLPAWIILRH
jgi:hypothetical protein